MADQSILEVDSVVNKAGTGAPDFPNGLGSSTFKLAKLFDNVTANNNFFKSGSGNLTITDSANLISTPDADGKFTFNETGLYLISYKAEFTESGSTAEERQCRIYCYIDEVLDIELTSRHQMANSADSGTESVQTSLATPYQVSSTSTVYYFNGQSAVDNSVDNVLIYFNILKLSN